MTYFCALLWQTQFVLCALSALLFQGAFRHLVRPFIGPTGSPCRLTNSENRGRGFRTKSYENVRARAHSKSLSSDFPPLSSNLRPPLMCTCTYSHQLAGKIARTNVLAVLPIRVFLCYLCVLLFKKVHSAVLPPSCSIRVRRGTS